MNPLEPALSEWLDLIDGLAPRILGADDRTGAPLAAEVARLSEAYTRERHAIPRAGKAWAARLRFFLPRDLFKIYGPLRELVWADAMPRRSTLRVLDLGAGLGTTSLGVGAFARELGIARVEIDAVEQHAAALDLFVALARAATERGHVSPLAITHHRGDLESGPLPGRDYDLIVVGLTLNELFADRELEERIAAREAWSRRVLHALAPDGAMILLEPASRDHARDLQFLRDRLVERVFAPCLRQGQCPLLSRERDWCHSQLPLVLPDRLADIARAAGLRAERLTYAYLTLRRDGRRLLDADRAAALRLVSNPLASKGKVERDGCGEVGLVRLRLLDRDRTEADGWIEADRGTLLRLPEPVRGTSLRIRPGHGIEPIS